ncbi:hypothetical protein DM01DRAFT_1298963 [Hesseltinella vesiculosa]|uniref:Uncharacterized protein n=1 Tax=Hesseltinella vesiculosa TaxID=101127 RepID=A0A1X2GWA7_9FUNG|nr:hypothetical protein DM01DRAFT_1298963 [Hesseltinella vesiculosa]
MSDLQWCTTCDKALSPFSDSLYCSEECLRQDAISPPPQEYEFPELQDFPRRMSLATSILTLSPALSFVSNVSSSMSSTYHHTPSLSPIPSPQQHCSFLATSLSDDVLHLGPPQPDDKRMASPLPRPLVDSQQQLMDQPYNVF